MKPSPYPKIQNRGNKTIRERIGGLNYQVLTLMERQTSN